LIPFPFAAEDHQTFNAKIFADAGAALLFQQSELSAELLESKVLGLMAGHIERETAIDPLQMMAMRAGKLAVRDSAERLAQEVRRLVQKDQS
jgi:UDP-N-acetylglucosamine--N-acetylmuramyl-(pentapeptide) pyrophosphoryl-undecaprenol N-acetylglucosamine transferase